MVAGAIRVGAALARRRGEQRGDRGRARGGRRRRGHGAGVGGIEIARAAHPTIRGERSIVNRTTVFVYASDPLTQAGTAALLRQRHDLLVIEDDPDAAAVAVVTADVVDEQVELLVRAIQRNGCPRVVMVIGRLDEAALMAGVAGGACGFVRRSEATAAHLGTVITTVANGDGYVPNDLLGKLLRQVTELHDSVLVPSGVAMNGL